jgi:hypothetical protein
MPRVQIAEVHRMMTKGRYGVRNDVLADVERRGRELARTFHVPFEDLSTRYARSAGDDGALVVQIRYAGHILDKVMLGRGEWEDAPK